MNVALAHTPGARGMHYPTTAFHSGIDLVTNANQGNGAIATSKGRAGYDDVRGRKTYTSVALSIVGEKNPVC